jgi:hypothetical protein
MLCTLLVSYAHAQDNSVARIWVDELMRSIQLDAPRPTVHARDLFHVSAALYDAWAVYDTVAQPYLLGNTVGGFSAPFSGITWPDDMHAAREVTISYAAFRLLQHRALNSAGVETVLPRLFAVMDSLGYDPAYTAEDYLLGGAAALGNHIASQYIAFGLQDGSNELNGHANVLYQPLNFPLMPDQPGNPSMQYPDRWQPLLFNEVDELGQTTSLLRSFAAAEWGSVQPFALGLDQLAVLERDGVPWNVYLNPGPPALLNMSTVTGLDSPYKWGFCMNSIWQSHLRADGEVLWDTSPASMGNVNSYPTDQAGLEAFYDLFGGGDASTGHPVNPVTGQAYVPQWVDRGDHARALAEYWSHGLDGATTPERWFQFLLDAMDHPLFERRWMGEGPVLDAMEYDVKAFFTLGAALHDAAVAAWSNKAYHDHVRPISALRFMVGLGQSSDPQALNFQAGGIPLIPGFVEAVLSGDPLAGSNNEHVGKIKLYTYLGPGAVDDPTTEVAGVGWVLAENWMPYQDPGFVAPPDAGYVSGSSAFSRAAAEVLAAITGSEFFPGGMYAVALPQNTFLQNEMGPSQAMELQWATYFDAADACGLAQIWGGVNSPQNDMAGRRLGMQVGALAFDRARSLIEADRPRVIGVEPSREVSNRSHIGELLELAIIYDRPMDEDELPTLVFLGDDPFPSALEQVSFTWAEPHRAVLVANILDVAEEFPFIAIVIDGATAGGQEQATFLSVFPFILDTFTPYILETLPQDTLLNVAAIGDSALVFRLVLVEPCDTALTPDFVFQGAPEVSGLFEFDAVASAWEDELQYRAVFTLLPSEVDVPSVDVLVSNIRDRAGNPMEVQLLDDLFGLDLKAPQLQVAEASAPSLSLQNVGDQAWTLELGFDEAMSTASFPQVQFLNGDPFPNSLEVDPVLSQWLDDTSFQFRFTLMNADVEWPELDLLVSGFADIAGNPGVPFTSTNILTIDTRRPLVEDVQVSTQLLADADVGANALRATVVFDEPMDTTLIALVQATPAAGLLGSLVYAPALSGWFDELRFEAVFSLVDAGVDVDGAGVVVSFAKDRVGNTMTTVTVEDLFRVDTRNPELISLIADPEMVTDADLGAGRLVLTAVFDEPMSTVPGPVFGFEPAGPLSGSLVHEEAASSWTGANTFQAYFGVYAAPVSIPEVAVVLDLAQDAAGNAMEATSVDAVFGIQLSGVGIAEQHAPIVLRAFPNPVLSGAPLHIHGALPMGVTEFHVLDAQGRRVHGGQVVPGYSGGAIVAVQALAPGLYQLLMHAGPVRYTVRFVVEGG